MTSGKGIHACMSYFQPNCRTALAPAGAVLVLVATFVGLHLSARDEARSGIRFRDAGTRAGVNGITICGKQRKTSVIEVNGSGVCWLDYNNDGLLDLYVVNGGTLEDLNAERN